MKSIYICVCVRDRKHTEMNFAKTRKPKMRNVSKLLDLRRSQQRLCRSGFSHYPLVRRETFVSGSYCFQHAASFVQVSLLCVSSYLHTFLPSPMYRLYFFSLALASWRSTFLFAAPIKFVLVSRVMRVNNSQMKQKG